MKLSFQLLFVFLFSLLILSQINCQNDPVANADNGDQAIELSPDDDNPVVEDGANSDDLTKTQQFLNGIKVETYILQAQITLPTETLPKGEYQVCFTRRVEQVNREICKEITTDLKQKFDIEPGPVIVTLKSSVTGSKAVEYRLSIHPNPTVTFIEKYEEPYYIVISTFHSKTGCYIVYLPRSNTNTNFDKSIIDQALKPAVYPNNNANCKLGGYAVTEKDPSMYPVLIDETLNRIPRKLERYDIIFSNDSPNSPVEDNRLESIKIDPKE